MSALKRLAWGLMLPLAAGLLVVVPATVAGASARPVGVNPVLGTAVREAGWAVMRGTPIWCWVIIG